MIVHIEALSTDFTATELASVRIHADADALALLPKSIRLNSHGLAYIEFRSNGVNGGTNETGAKRMRSLFRAAAKHKVGIVFAHPTFVRNALNAPSWGFGMHYLTRSELDSLLESM